MLALSLSALRRRADARDEGFLRDQMTEFDLLADGSVIAVPGGGCV